MSDSHDPIATAPQSSSSSRSNASDAGDFECNICFDLPQDPVITLCGHLYCWPCLYRWLRVHSQCHECPVCKALIEEEKIIPLYGRGKTPSDPRSKPVPGVEIPNRPAGQRPDTAPLPDNNFSNVMLGLMGGFLPFASASFSSIGMSAGFGGVFSPFFGVQFHGFSSGGGHGGSSSGYHYGYTGGPRQNREASPAAQSDDENLKKILCVVIVFVLFAFLTM